MIKYYIVGPRRKKTLQWKQELKNFLKNAAGLTYEKVSTLKKEM